MRIVWDEPKHLANIANHEMDFPHLDEAFFETAVIVPVKFDRLAATIATALSSWCSLGWAPRRSALSACARRVGKNGD
jgi:uncharacterized DUF497 family protein